MKEKKNADKSPNIIIIYLPGRNQISKIGKILQKKKERERECIRLLIPPPEYWSKVGIWKYCADSRN